MTPPCPIERETLDDYFAGELSSAEEEAVEDHVFECAGCARAFDAAGGLSAALRESIPVVVSRAWLDRVGARGTTTRVTELSAGDHADVEFPRGADMLVHLLRADLSASSRPALEILSNTGAPLTRIEGVPFDASRGEVLVACQRHYMEAFPRLIHFRIVDDGRGGAVLGEYAVNHVMPDDRAPD